MLGLRWRGRECRAARRGARAAVSRRSSARRGNSRLRLLPLAIPSPRASPARCAPGICGPRPRDKAPFGRFAPGFSSRAAVAARLRGLRLRGVRSAPPCPAGAAGAVAGRAAPPVRRRLYPARTASPRHPASRRRRGCSPRAHARSDFAAPSESGSGTGGAWLRGFPHEAVRLSAGAMAGRAAGERRRRGERRPRRCRARPSEVGPGRVKAAESRRTPRSGPRGRVRRAVRPERTPESRRSRTRDAPGVPLRGNTASAKTGSRMRGEERGGALPRAESRGHGSEGGSEPAERPGPARPPRERPAERPRIREHRVLGARSTGRAGRIAATLFFEPA